MMWENITPPDSRTGKIKVGQNLFVVEILYELKFYKRA